MAKKINPSFLSYALNFELKEKPFQNILFFEQIIMTIDAYKQWRNIAVMRNVERILWVNSTSASMPVVLQWREYSQTSLLSTQNFGID